MDVRGQLMLGSGSKHEQDYVGEARSGNSTVLIGSGRETSFSTYVALSQYQLQKLQERVSGGDVRMSLYLSGNYSFRNPPSDDINPSSPAEVKSVFTIPWSDWAKQIDRCGFSDLMLFELEIPDSDAPDKLQDAVGSLRKAKSDIDKGEFSDAAYRSRKVLESCREALGDMPDLDRAKSEYRGKTDGAGREDMSLTSRELLAADVAKHFMDQAPHPDGSGQRVQYNRRQATLALRLAEAFLTSAIGRYGESE